MLPKFHIMKVVGDTIQRIWNIADILLPGCLIVELLDYRPQRAKEPVLESPGIQRVVLRPSPETLWTDLCLINQRTGSQWTDLDALEVEARILVGVPSLTTLDIKLNFVWNRVKGCYGATVMLRS